MPDVYLTILDTDKFRTNCLSVNLLRPLRREEAAMNALLPDVLDTLRLFPSVAHGPLPRKAFSMGQASEKRCYFECRRIR